MEANPSFYNKDEYIETLQGNRVSKKSVLCGSQNIRLAGKTVIKPGGILRGDLSNIIIGRYSVVGENTVIRPSYKRFKDKGFVFIPLTVGDYVFIDDNCVVSSAQIGSYVHIGKNCVISRRCILKDCCKIADNTILAPDTVVPPFTLFSGSPGTYTAELPEAFQEIQTQFCLTNYDLMQLAKS